MIKIPVKHRSGVVSYSTDEYELYEADRQKRIAQREKSKKILKPEEYKGYKIEFTRFYDYIDKRYYVVAEVVYPPNSNLRSGKDTKTEAFNEIKTKINKIAVTPSRIKTRFDELIDQVFIYDDEWDLDHQVKWGRAEIKDTKSPVAEKKAALARLRTEYKEHKQAFEDRY